MLRGLFAGARERRELARVEAGRVKLIAEELLGSDTNVTVNEIACLDPGCPGTETVVLLMRADRRTEAVKIGKPMAEITRQDLQSALAGQTGTRAATDGAVR